jgi:hypothetical protein
MGEKTNRYDYLEAIHTKKHNTKIIKDLTNIGAKLVCLFPTIAFSLGAICCKIVRAKGNQNPNIKWLL